MLKSPGIYLTAEDVLGKHQSARRLSMKAVLPVVESNGVPYFQMMSLNRTANQGWSEQGSKERMGEFNYTKCLILL